MPHSTKRHLSAEEGHVNLTPMIDVVFQLIIFFMLVTELTNLALEQVTLPIAVHAQEIKGGEGQVVVNIKNMKGVEGATQDGMIVIAGQEIKGEGRGLVKKLTERLQLEADAHDKWTPNRNHPSGKNSELEILVRSDRQVKAQYFLYLMWACNDVGIYKVQVAAQQARLASGDEPPQE